MGEGSFGGVGGDVDDGDGGGVVLRVVGRVWGCKGGGLLPGLGVESLVGMGCGVACEGSVAWDGGEASWEG